MNNDTTQHDTTPDTTRHYMEAHSLGHHVWVAGNAYVENAKEALEAGQTWLAETFLVQAEKALVWANALQAGVVSLETEDLLGVDVDVRDAWVRTSEIARAWAMVRGEVLPEPPSHVDVAGHSPKNVSRETLSPLPPSPQQPTQSGYIGVMETYTAQPTATDLVAQLISVITAEVVKQVSSEMENIAETVCENALDARDFAEEVTESYGFSSAVESAIHDMDITDIVRDAVRELTFSVSVD